MRQRGEIAREYSEIDLRREDADCSPLTVLDGNEQRHDLPTVRGTLLRSGHRRLAAPQDRVEDTLVDECLVRHLRAARGEHVPVDAGGDEAMHEGVLNLDAMGEHLEVGVLDAIERPKTCESEKTLGLTAQYLVELAGDELGHVQLVLVGEAAALGQIVPELEGRRREERQQDGQHEDRELRPDRQAHERARARGPLVSIAQTLAYNAAMPRGLSMNLSTLVLIALALVATGVAYWKDPGLPMLGAKNGLSMVWFVLPRLIPALILAGMLQVIIPQETVAQYFGQRSGIGAILMASAAGVLTPGGPMVSVPLLVVLANSGMALGIAWEAPLMGWRFVLVRVVPSLAFPVIAGWLVKLYYHE